MPRASTVRIDYYPDEEALKILDEQPKGTRNQYITEAIKSFAGVPAVVLSDEQIKSLGKEIAVEVKAHLK